MQYYYDNWCTITDEKEVLEAIQGYKIPFMSKPFQLKPPEPVVFSDIELRAVEQSVDKLCRIGAVKVVEAEVGQFVKNFCGSQKRWLV